jgi:tRNA threonylcarbamoyladenosine biosynthesis protein TsaE
MEKMEIRDESELRDVARGVLALLEEKKVEGKASVLALHGDLGAGKTAFVKKLAEELKVSEVVTSPTFVILKMYPLEDAPFETLAHIDAYRVEDQDEMRVIRFSDLINDEGTLVCIEWAEKIEALLPPSTLHMTFAIKGELHEITFEHHAD